MGATGSSINYRRSHQFVECAMWQRREKEVGRTQSVQYTLNAGWSSLVARWAHNPKVAGSNPAPATKWERRPKAKSSLFYCIYKDVRLWATSLVPLCRFRKSNPWFQTQSTGLAPRFVIGYPRTIAHR